MKLRIATRRSPLALWQARHVAALLKQDRDVSQVELVELVTTGDRILDKTLSKIGGKGLFIKELEHAMLEQRADLAVHSMKDVPATLPDGFVLPVVLPREDPRDGLVGATLDQLSDGAHVGTSSLRRQSQLLALRPDLKISPIRGNVGTRLEKLERGDFDAIMLAVAGMKRLGLIDQIAEALDPDLMLPAAGQGIVGIECHEENTALINILRRLDCEESRLCVEAERAITKGLHADCHAPLGVHATQNKDTLQLAAVVALPDGQEIIRVQQDAPIADSAALAASVTAELIDLGADELLRQAGE